MTPVSSAMNDFFRWFYEFRAHTDWQAMFAGVAVVVSLLALWHSRRSSKAAERSAKAAEANSNLARAAFENEAKRVKASAYWALYRINKNLQDGGRAQGYDPSPIRNMLAVYGHTLTLDQRLTLNKALAAIESMMASTVALKVETDKIQPQLMGAMAILKEDWMVIDVRRNEEKL